jgi:SAM-dependent methyltransferase
LYKRHVNNNIIKNDIISDTGFWNIEGAQFDNSHYYDESLSNSICSFVLGLGVKKLYDFGCGKGKYVDAFRTNGIDATGFDGNPITSSIPYCKVQDLTSPNFQFEPVDFIMCLEVGEHVPKEFESALLSNIDKHLNPNGTLVLSWAIVGQPGFGHVNCQNNDYVIRTVESLGYSINTEAIELLRNSSTLSWFKDTILVFNKYK